MWRYAFVIYESIIQEIAGFVKVGGDTYLLREDRAGNECQDYYDNCFYKKEGDRKHQQLWTPTWLLLGHDMWWMDVFWKAFGLAGVGLNVLRQSCFLDALASLKTMLKIKSVMISRLQDFKSITDYYRVLQSVTEGYRVLQTVTVSYRVLQSITE